MAGSGIRIRVDASQAQREGRKAQQAFREVGDSARKAESRYSRFSRALGNDRHWQTMQRGLGRTTKMLTSFQSALFGAAGAAGMGYFIDRNIQAADQIGKTAAKVGVGVEALQELRYAAELAGVSQKNLDQGLQRFSRRVAEAAQGQGELLKVVEKYGVSLRDSQGRLRSTNELLGEFAQVVRNAESEQEQLRLAFKMFDSEGAAMVNLLREGSDGMNDLRKDARELGIVLDRDTVKNAEKANNQLTKLKKVVGAQLTQVVVDLAPEIGDVADRMGDWVQGNKDFLTQDVPGHIRDISSSIDDMATALNKIPKPILYAGLGALAGGRLGPYGALAFGAGGFMMGLDWEGQAVQIENVNERIEDLKERLESAREELEGMNEGHILYEEKQQAVENLNKALQKQIFMRDNLIDIEQKAGETTNGLNSEIRDTNKAYQGFIPINAEVANKLREQREATEDLVESYASKSAAIGAWGGEHNQKISAKEINNDSLLLPAESKQEKRNHPERHGCFHGLRRAALQQL